RLPIAIGAVLLASLLGLAAALGRGLLRRSFPTPASAAKTLGAPVLAVLPRTRKAKKAAALKPLRGKPDLRIVENP
ncbi:MAG TPA: hypothetical protein VG943_03895, partial [Caulobacterales bacterium]|nr:hypothetical protein [Caulobacterales bacterium]